MAPSRSQFYKMGAVSRRGRCTSPGCTQWLTPCLSFCVLSVPSLLSSPWLVVGWCTACALLYSIPGPPNSPKIRTGVLVERGYAIWGAELHFRCNRRCNRRFCSETATILASEASAASGASTSSSSARRRRKFFCGNS